MEHHPRDLAHFVETGARVDRQHREFQPKGSGEGAGEGDPPHADDQTVDVEDRVAARREDTVYHHRADAAPDHVYRQYHEHADHVFVRQFRERDEVRYERYHGQYHQRRKSARRERQHHRALAVGLPELQTPRAELVADHDPAPARETVAETAHEIPRHGGNGVGGGGVRAEVPHERRVGGEADPPQQPRAEDRQHVAQKIGAQHAVEGRDVAELEPDEGLLVRRRHAPY